MTDINKLIEETERLLAAATPGPWEVVDDGDCIREKDCGEDQVVAVLDMHSHRDARLMAHAPASLRALVDEVKRLRHDLDFAKEPQEADEPY